MSSAMGKTGTWWVSVTADDVKVDWLFPERHGSERLIWQYDYLRAK